MGNCLDTEIKADILGCLGEKFDSPFLVMLVCWANVSEKETDSFWSKTNYPNDSKTLSTLKNDNKMENDLGENYVQRM